MRKSEAYTTEELAELLKVSKLTVYDLIKKGEIQAYRVGRQMRVDARELENYKLRKKEIQTEKIFSPAEKPVKKKRAIVICGQDQSLDLLTREIEMTTTMFSSFRSHVGSLDGLISMYQGKAHIVSTHLFDGDTKSYNLPYIRKILVSKSFVVIRFIKRQVGLYVAPGNPKQIQNWDDLARRDITIINREDGAGVRVLLDEQLRLRNIKRQQVHGYYDVQTSHLGIASTVASGKADAGVGIQNSAKLADIDFIPMMKENYDLVMLKNNENDAFIQTVKNILNEPSFQEKLVALNYDIKGIGEVIYEQ